MVRVGQNHIYIYIQCIYGTFGREITKYTVIYGGYIRFWPTLHMVPSYWNNQIMNTGRVARSTFGIARHPRMNGSILFAS
jgi:hypothetical protein